MDFTRLAISPARAGGWARLVPGALTAALAAAIAQEGGNLVHAPAPLTAVLLGLALTGVRPGLAQALAPGLNVAAKPGLKVAVALMGAQIAWGELMALGLPSLIAGATIVFGGIVAGGAIGLALGLPLAEAMVAACAVSICGASAALAVSQVAPPGPDLARKTALVVVGVNLLSTAAMLGYPLLTAALGFGPRQAGLFFGLSIHDLAQVTGAGAAVSPAATHAATLAKLGRILWLGPVVMLAGAYLARRDAIGETKASIAPPAFVWGFAALALARGLGLLAPGVIALFTQASTSLLLAAVFAMSAGLAPGAILKAPARLVAALGLTTVVVAGFAMAAVTALPS